MSGSTARSTAAVALAALLVAAACGSDGGAGGGEQGAELGDVDLVASLERFDGCDELVDHLKGEALERVGPYGFDGPIEPLGDGVIVPEGAELFDDAGEAVAAAEPGEPGQGGDGGRVAGIDHSTTNIQEAGVDEADSVKTDGERILAVADERLHWVDVSDGAATLAGSVALPRGWGHEILVEGDRVLVLVSTDRGAELAVVDVSDPTDMEVTSTLSVDGHYLSARKVGDMARVVVSSPPPVFDFVYPSSPSRRAEAAAEETNRRMIADSTIEDWLPTATLRTDGERTSSELVDCDRVHRPGEFSGFSTVAVLTVPMDAPLGTGDAVAVLADGETVYASADSLYVATNHWVDALALDEEPPGGLPRDEGYATALHKFDISGSGPASYAASGAVRGHLLNQFAMSEHDGYLRVATTDGAPWSVTDRSESYVTVLADEDGRLEEVGQVGDLGRGERIYSVRFVGDVGYVVTFRETDPLYTVDLSDPTDPTTRGELKILGYSAYLHPVDDTTLLGVGQDATEGGRTLGTQVSLFDVSDLTDPTRTAQLTLAGASSEVELDHRAFLYWAPTGLAVLPVETYGAGPLVDDVVEEIVEEDPPGRSERFVGALGLSIGSAAGEGAGIEEVGRIVAGDRPIRRSLVVGDAVYALTDDGLVISDLTTLAPLGEVAFG